MGNSRSEGEEKSQEIAYKRASLMSTAGWKEEAVERATERKERFGTRASRFIP
jgi:hypothetical protein